MYLTRKQKEAVGVAIAVAIFLPISLLVFGYVGRSISIPSGVAPSTTPASEQPSLPTPPVVTYLEGFVDGKSETSADWGELHPGSELDRGSLVRTGFDSAADIRLQDRSVVRVMEETVFSLASLGTQRIEMEVQEGEVVTRLERIIGTQELTIRSESTVAGVRGTELVVSVEPQRTTVYGLSGTVEVWNPRYPDDTVRLGIHEKSVVADGVPTDPIPMAPEEIAYYARILESLHEQQVYLVSSEVTFLPDSADLTPEAEAELRRIYGLLQLVNYDFQIVGHSAAVGSPESQMQLSTERANRVMEYLLELGIPASRLSAAGAGGTRPIAEGDDPESLRLNRRVEFLVIQE